MLHIDDPSTNTFFDLFLTNPFYTGVELVPLGLYIIRGDSVITIGEVDEEIDSNIDFSSIKADPLPSIVRM